MKITVDMQWLSDRMPGVVEHHRRRMTYGSIAVKRGVFSRKQVPVADSADYWMMMCEFSPWCKLKGVFSAIQYGDMSHSAQLDCDVYSMIVSAARYDLN